jgi:hypothetical protein
LDAVCRYDAERQGEGQRHDQAEQDLRDPVHRFEDSIGQFGRKLRDRIDCHWESTRFSLGAAIASTPRDPAGATKSNLSSAP